MIFFFIIILILLLNVTNPLFQGLSFLVLLLNMKWKYELKKPVLKRFYQRLFVILLGIIFMNRLNWCFDITLTHMALSRLVCVCVCVLISCPCREHLQYITSIKSFTQIPSFQLWLRRTLCRDRDEDASPPGCTFAIFFSPPNSKQLRGRL